MKPQKKSSASAAPVSSENSAPKPHRTPQDVRRDNLRTDIGNDDPKILGR